MTGRLLVMENGGYAPAGLLGGWAADRALAVDTVALHAGEPLPADISGYAAAVSLGSGRAAYDDTVPWLAGSGSPAWSAIVCTARARSAAHSPSSPAGAYGPCSITSRRCVTGRRAPVPRSVADTVRAGCCRGCPGAGEPR